MKYKLRHLEDDIYQIYDTSDEDDFYGSTVLFQGTLSECDAWLNLHEKGYL